MFSNLKHPYERLLCRDKNLDNEAGETMQDRLRSMRHATAKSKSGVWGPTHSFDSEDEDENDVELLNKTTGDRSGGTNTTHEDSFSSPDTKGTRSNMTKRSDHAEGKYYSKHRTKLSRGRRTSRPMSPLQCSSASDYDGIIAGIWNNAIAVVNELISGDCSGPCHHCRANEQVEKKTRKHGNRRSSRSSAPIQSSTNTESNIAATLGIPSPPSKEISFKYKMSNASSLTDGLNEKSTFEENDPGDEEARAAARKMAAETNKSSRHQNVNSNNGDEKLLKNPLSDIKHVNKGKAPPFSTIQVNKSMPFQKSISELTMRSSYGEATTPISDMRRMAYYAVGKNHSPKGSKKSNTGGNRKCYFTGEPIISGRPFYAGSVQQGMRTLIVFCLPSALSLPRKEDLERVNELEVNSQLEGRKGPDEMSRRTMTGLSTAALSQHDSIYNDEGFVTSEFFQQTSWTEDEDGNLCESLNVELLVQALPDPNRNLLLYMQETFPEQFASLSPHLRRPQCWRLYIKFCFFSGLPIADGEMYYKVMDDVVSGLGGKRNATVDEIVLSHEVMEAVSGESADLRILPGNNTFKYLQKHYKQQCAKLTPQKIAKKVFDRSSWIRVMPEV